MEGKLQKKTDTVAKHGLRLATATVMLLLVIGLVSFIAGYAGWLPNFFRSFWSWLQHPTTQVHLQPSWPSGLVGVIVGVAIDVLLARTYVAALARRFAICRDLFVRIRLVVILAAAQLGFLGTFALVFGTLARW